MILVNAVVKYYNSYCVAYLPKDFSSYYLGLVPKAWYANVQRYDPHVTICRKLIESPSYNNWRYRDNEVISISYSPILQTDGTYYFFDCYSDDILDIRNKLNLPSYRVGYNSYHVTIGNSKNS